MASEGLFFAKDDSGWDQVWDLQQWAFNHFWGFQDLKVLLKTVLAWGAHTYHSQQPLPIYGH